MTKTMKAMCCVTVFAMTLGGVYGCQTYGEAAGLGGALGAGAGAIIGHQSGNAVAGALIGAAAGALTGLIIHDIKARKEKSAQETQQVYNYTPAQGEMMKFERAEVLPPSVRPGEEIEGTVQYALLGTGPGVQVSEQRTLMQGDRIVADISSQAFQRTDGTWVSSQPFRLPANTPPGRYTLVTTARTAQSAVSGRADFTVL